MSPAILRRIENAEGQGWSYMNSLDCYAMPGPHGDDGFIDQATGKFIDVAGRIFAWTGQSYEYWVSESDRERLGNNGYTLSTYFCPPGTFHIGHEQAVFDKDAAIRVAEESLV